MRHKEQSKNVLRNLGDLAEQHGVTQEQIAEKVGVRQPTVSQVFSARFHPTLDNVFKYLNAVNELAGTEYNLADIQPKAEGIDYSSPRYDI